MREEWEALEVEVGWGNGVEMMGAGEAVSAIAGAAATTNALARSAIRMRFMNSPIG